MRIKITPTMNRSLQKPLWPYPAGTKLIFTDNYTDDGACFLKGETLYVADQLDDGSVRAFMSNPIATPLIIPASYLSRICSYVTEAE